MSFETRWQIEGVFTVENRLHVGDGEWLPVEALADMREGEEVSVQVATTVQGYKYDGQMKRDVPVIPGTAIKAAVRRWAEKTGGWPDGILGSRSAGDEGADDPDTLGGAVEFHDAFMRSGLAAAPVNEPFWNAGRMTCIETRNAINRQRGAADHNKLYHIEYVPKGVTFEVRITATAGEPGIELVLEALAAFNLPGPNARRAERLRVGAEESGGWGCLKWELKAVRKLDAAQCAAQIPNWLRNPAAMPVGFDSTMPLAPAAVADMARKAEAAADARETAPMLRLEIELQVRSGFLVNDPSRTKRKSEDEGSNRPNHAPRLTPDGKALLPESSFRHTLRSQAEKIVRTMLDDERAATPGYEKRPHKDSMCPVSMLFGTTGWGSTVSCGDFTGERQQPEPLRRKEFNAVDRFTGGGAPGLKFNADYCERPKLKGWLTVDTGRLREKAGGDWPLAILLLALRDLSEGDITFGFGSSKAFGACERVTLNLTSDGAVSSFPDSLARKENRDFTAWCEEVARRGKAFLDLLR